MQQQQVPAGPRTSALGWAPAREKSGFLAGKRSVLPFKLAKLNWPCSFRQGCPTLH